MTARGAKHILRRMIEPLEPRIAPATVAVVGQTASWTDFDGDKVTLKWTVGAAPIFSTDDVGSLDGLVVKRIAFTGTNTGAAVTLTVKAAGGGDGRIDLGRVDATGVGLASWSSPRATIAEIDAGDGTASFKTFVSGGLGVHAVGLFSGAGGDGTSQIDGQIGTFTVNGDIAATKLQLNAAGATKITKVEIKGSLLGTAATSPADTGPSGVLEVFADEVGAIVIGGGIIGGKGGNTGVLQNFGSIGSLTIKGGVIGGEAGGAGTVTLASVKTLSIGGDLRGGVASGTGNIGANRVDSFTLGGSIFGGTVSETGTIGIGAAKTILIKGSIIGAQKLASGANSLTAALSVNSGIAGAPVASVTINGDLLGGSNASGVNVSYNGALIFGGNVTTLAIKGDIRGTDGLPAAILARGTTPLAGGNFNAIGRLTVGGDVTLATIAAGQTTDISTLGARIGNAENPDAGIGSVTVGGDWLHSSLTAGINDAGSNGVDLADTRSAGDADRQAVIGAIVIKGDLLDNGAFAGTSGFAAQKIAKLTASGQALFTTGGAAKTLNWDQIVFIRELV